MIQYIVLQIILGIFLADVFGGAAHWFEDTYIHYCTTIPFFSEIAKHNELHHYFPRAMLEGSYYMNIESTIVFAIILFIILYVLFPSTFPKYPIFYIVFFVFLCLVNLFHRFAHQRDCETNFIILKLQKLGILCSHEHHRLHHVMQPDGKYCTIVPATNYLLDTFYFWRILELIISIFGVKPDRKPVYNHYESIQNYMHENAKKECPKRPTENDVNILLKNLENHIKCY
jgi:hypothetical protein